MTRAPIFRVRAPISMRSDFPKIFLPPAPDCERRVDLSRRRRLKRGVLADRDGRRGDRSLRIPGRYKPWPHSCFDNRPQAQSPCGPPRGRRGAPATKCDEPARFHGNRERLRDTPPPTRPGRDDRSSRARRRRNRASGRASSGPDRNRPNSGGSQALVRPCGSLPARDNRASSR